MFPYLIESVLGIIFPVSLSQMAALDEFKAHLGDNERLSDYRDHLGQWCSKRSLEEQRCWYRSVRWIHRTSESMVF